MGKLLVDRGYAKNIDHAVQTITDLPYVKWREYDAMDTLRFYALCMREAGLIKTNPQKLLAQSGDWRFLNELKKELKA